MTQEKWTYPSTVGWAEYPFETDGVKFVSKVDKKGSIYKRIQEIPASIFDMMNKGAVANTIGDVSLFTREQLATELERVNLGAHEAVIELA